MGARYRKRLHRSFPLRLRNAHDVSDFAQEVFLRLLRVSECESIRSPEAYLITEARHAAQ